MMAWRRWLTAAAFALSAPAAAAQDFYSFTAMQVQGPPGSLIRIAPMDGLDGPPLGAVAYRVLYRSTGLNGEPIAVSGIVVVPPGDPPAEGRRVIAWAHPTTGVVSRCAPSKAFFVFQNMMGLRTMIREGYVVVATDYPGLGTVGPHPYLVGVSEARGVIDAVRAARLMRGVGAGNRFAVWGHSQGGQAALFTGMIVASYAPELQLVGVAAAAPATDLLTLLRDDAATDGGRNITAMTLWSWSRVYNLPIDRLVAAQAMPAVDALSNECIESVLDMFERRQSQKPLATTFLQVPDITRIEPWRTLLMQNIPGTLPPALPVFIAQGDADTLVRPEVTRAYMQALCVAGSRVSYLNLPGVKHGFAGSDSALAAIAWIDDRMDGKPAPSSCVAKRR